MWLLFILFIKFCNVECKIREQNTKSLVYGILGAKKKNKRRKPQILYYIDTIII